MTERRRPLAETLVDVAQGAVDAAGAAGLVSIRHVTVALPLEVAVVRRGTDWVLLGDVPRRVTRTAFDTDPGRLEVTWTRREPA